MSRSWSLLALGLACLSACSDPAAAPPSAAVPDGGAGSGGGDGACGPGARVEPDGRCLAAGIEPDECAEGFESDGERGCSALLPPRSCPFGQVAVPGEQRCREIAPCPPGTWGALVTDADTQHVDASYTGADSDGSAAKPWRTVVDAIDAAKSGALVAIAAGTYDGDIATPKPVHLAGRCPSLVTIAGTGTLAAVVLQGDGSSIRSVSVTGPGVGIGIGLARDVVIADVHVHDTENRGIDVEAGATFASVTLDNVLVENARDIGVFSYGSELVVERSTIRGTRPAVSPNIGGRGIVVRRAPASSIRSSVVESNHDIGVLVSGSVSQVEGCVVRDTLPDTDGTSGRGLSIQSDGENGAPSDADVVGSVVERNHDVGIFVQGSIARVDTTTVRDTLVADDPMHLGSGLHAQSTARGRTTEMIVARSTARHNRFSALTWFGATGSMDRVLAGDTQPDPAGEYGRGVIVAYDSDLAIAASTDVRASVVERNFEVGLFVQGSRLAVEGSIVRATAPRPNDGMIGRGVAAQSELGPMVPADVTLLTSLVEDSHEVGVHIDGSFAVLREVVVRGTKARPGDELFGDGIEVSSFTPVPRARAEVADCFVEGSARAGVSSFSSDLVVSNTTMSCNGIDLAAQTLNDPYALDDKGGNVCGCGDLVACQVFTAGIQPPDPLAQ